MVKIRAERLLGDLHRLRDFGRTGNGVVRPSYSDVDMAAREWLRQRFTDAGLNATVDGVGNVFGTSSNTGPALVLGSHSDTQPRGGWLDGALGVIYALEVARALAEDSTTRDFAVDVAAWVDEEGTYTSCLGSRSFVDDLPAEVLAHANDDGETVVAALARVGLADASRATMDLDRHIGYLEAHIEQGPYLEEAGDLIGVVTSIVGIRSTQVEFTGEQNHAGTTPMNRRRDAGVAMFEFAVRLRERFSAIAGPTTVWTIGQAQLEPGAASIIPGYAVAQVQYRDPDDDRLAILETVVSEIAAEVAAATGVTVLATRERDPILPCHMDPEFRRHFTTAAEAKVPGMWREMPSAAGHDPMVISQYLPCAMVFIPSIGGISHDFAEDSNEADIVMGCAVMADAAASILHAARSSTTPIAPRANPPGHSG
ncbi:MAG: hydantoinase/carbamoylase family amidase [Acidimicrobiales bacterium]|nr:hydantoinase/carbamoylase family amidase [Acidimicrobiales bacterium]MDG2216717.1 hydantoinase/carbamoylase family amidase [Acidimicrobiales bacterium]